MNIFSKAYCRVYQTIFKWLIPYMPYREPEILNSTSDVRGILEKNNVNRVLLVTDKGIRGLNLTENLEKDLKENDIKVSIFDDTVPNPTIQNIEDAYALYLKDDCQAIISFGYRA